MNVGRAIVAFIWVIAFGCLVGVIYDTAVGAWPDMFTMAVATASGTVIGAVCTSDLRRISREYRLGRPGERYDGS